MFRTASGRPQERNNFGRALRAAGDAAKLNPPGAKKVAPHDLRHSCAGLLLAAGVPAPKVAAILRHADAPVTLTVYAGLVESQRVELRGRPRNGAPVRAVGHSVGHTAVATRARRCTRPSASPLGKRPDATGVHPRDPRSRLTSRRSAVRSRHRPLEGPYLGRSARRSPLTYLRASEAEM
ncbi:MAG: tyrosine-type recombinase/integrase [Gaiellaceae bacterium]